VKEEEKGEKEEKVRVEGREDGDEEEKQVK
jgi:hypothetical protein